MYFNLNEFLKCLLMCLNVPHSATNDVIFPSSSVIEKPLPNFSKLLDSPQLLTNSVTNRSFFYYVFFLNA